MNPDGTFAAITRVWRFTSAQAEPGVKILDVPAGKWCVVTFAKAICANSNTVDVSVRVGFGATGLATLTANDLTGVAGEFLSHGGVAKGSGEVNSKEPLAIGADGEDIYYSGSTPTGGDIRIILQYRLIDS